MMTELETTRIYVVRHGETEWNLAGKYQGHMDSRLTERGLQQAHALAERLTQCGISFIYSSDLGRALKTAEIISGKLDIQVQTDERIRERHLGLVQGLTRDEFRNQFSDEWINFTSRDPDYQIPNGESARQRYERSVACLEEFAKLHSGGTILIVAHGGVLSGLFYKTVGLPLSEPRRFSIPNAAINRFSVSSDSWRLDTWGGISHLQEIELKPTHAK